MDKTLFTQRYNVLCKQVADACVASGRDASDVRIIVVTKTHPAEVLQTVIDSGVVDLGENRVQEIEAKVPHLSGAFTMHCIGHLQTNKVNKVVPLVSWIQSVDSIRLAEKIDKAAGETGKKILALVQVNTSGEESKSGCTEAECRSIAEYIAKCKNMEFRGLMTIGPLNGTESQVRTSFAKLRELGKTCADLADHIELSMGMSSDFAMAIAEGSTMIRVGTMLLGER